MPQDNNPVQIRIHRFFVKYKQAYETYEHTNPTTGETEFRSRKVHGKQDEEHWVEYSPLGSDKSVIEDSIRRLRAVQDPHSGVGNAATNPAIGLAAARWAFIEPHYNRWLQGHEPTADGTPLAAWSGLGREQAEVLRTKGIATVQQLAKLTDTHFQTMGIPGLRAIVDNAKRFLAALDTSVVEEKLEEQARENAVLRDELAEMKKILASIQAASPAAVPAKPVSDADFDPPDDWVDPTADEEEPVPAKRRRA